MWTLFQFSRSHSPFPPPPIFHFPSHHHNDWCWNTSKFSSLLMETAPLFPATPLSPPIFLGVFARVKAFFPLFPTQFQGKFRLIRWDWFNWETGYRLDYLVWIPGHVDLCCLFPCMRVPRSTYGQWLFWREVYPIWNSHWTTQKVILISILALVKYN